MINHLPITNLVVKNQEKEKSVLNRFHFNNAELRVNNLAVILPPVKRELKIAVTAHEVVVKQNEL